MTLTEATLTEITRRLVATYQPEQVVLFGSHAWGEPEEDSDVDLLVVLSESDEPAYRRASAGSCMAEPGFPSVDGRPTVGHSRPRVSADPCA